MKRLLSILLVSVLVFSATATVYAAENSGGSSTINVAGEYFSASTGEVVSVDVGWEEMSFKYTEGGKQWDPGTHSYIGGENGGWSDNKPGITMTNHSNVDVVAELSFAPAASVTGTFYSKSGDTYTALSADEQGAILSAAAEGSEQSAADAKTFYFGISGGAITKNATLGTITVSISFKPSFNEADLAAFTYTTDSYGRVKITGVKDTSVTELVVPDFIYEIERGALADCTSLVKLTVPFAGNRSNGEQTYIGYAFGANNYTESGTVLPATLKDITVTGGYAKNDTLDTFAFYDCTNLTNIVIGDGVTYINPSVFVDCISLESLTVPFLGDCKKEITDSYQLPLNYLFGYSDYGTKYTDNVHLVYGILNEMYSDRKTSAFDGEKIYSYIPNTLKEVTVNGGAIGDKAFEGQVTIEKVILGNGVNAIGYMAFGNCNNLNEVIIPDSVIDISMWAFRNTPYQNTLLANAEDGFIYINKVLYEYHGSDTDVVIKDGTVAVSDFAFGENTKIEKVTCPDSLRYLGCAVGQSADGVFFKCTNLKTVVLNEGLEHIGVGAFENCSAIDNFDFPDSLNYVGYLAFSGTSWANNLPKGEIYIGKIFYKYNPQGELTEPTTITVKEGTVGIADRAFCRFETDYADFVNLVGVNIPDSVTWIGDEAFYRATDLQEIKLPKNLTELGWRAFGFCASLKEITIPKGVKKLPQYIFASCSGISVRFEENSQLNTICDRSITSGVYYMPEGIQYIFDDLDGTVLVTSMNKLRAVKSSWSVRVLVPTYADVGWTFRAGSTVVYYYSDEKPAVSPRTGEYIGTFWHYDENGKPVKWE